MDILICIAVTQLHPFDYQRAEGQEFKRLPMKTDFASGDKDKGVVVCSLLLPPLLAVRETWRNTHAAGIASSTQTGQMKALRLPFQCWPLQAVQRRRDRLTDIVPWLSSLMQAWRKIVSKITLTVSLVRLTLSVVNSFSFSEITVSCYRTYRLEIAYAEYDIYLYLCCTE